MGGSPVDDLVGIFAGHCYYFCEDVQNYKLRAPQFFADLIDAGGAHAPPAGQQRNMFGNHAWGGGGQRLGG